MFCENCGIRVEDDQPFCPNCGKRMGGPSVSNSAPANSGFHAPAMSASARAVSNSGGLLGKFNAMQGLEKIFYPIVGGLLLLNFILIMLPIYHESFMGYSVSTSLARAYPFWSNLFMILFTLSITFFVLDYFDKFSFKFLRLFILIVSALLLILFVILWIVSETGLSVAGWFFFLLQIGLTTCSVFLFLEKTKK